MIRTQYCKNGNNQVCWLGNRRSRRSMDRTQACGACNVGSIPTESTPYIKRAPAGLFLFPQKVVDARNGVATLRNVLRKHIAYFAGILLAQWKAKMGDAP